MYRVIGGNRSYVACMERTPQRSEGGSVMRVRSRHMEDLPRISPSCRAFGATRGLHPGYVSATIPGYGFAAAASPLPKILARLRERLVSMLT